MNLKHSMLALSIAFAARFAPPKAADPLPAADLVPEYVPEAPRTEAPPAPRPEPRRFGRNLVRALARQGRSTNTPHQSTRETARRLGGAEWEAYKSADRARRGLGG